MTRPRHILVPTDFSDAANAARAYAMVLAEAFGATLHILHVVPDPHAMGWGADAVFLSELMERNERSARAEIEATLTAEERARFRAVLAVATGVPVNHIIEYARDHEIDLIVMGTHGRSTLERMWIGSVTQGVLRRATCPVVSVQQPRP